MEFPSQDTTVNIATKGLPFSGTREVSEVISRWARSPVFRLDSILEELYKEGKYNATSRPSKEEDERLQCHAFSILCQVAMAQVELNPKVLNCVVINSSLSSTSQLDQLIDFSKRLKRGPHKLLIIECRIRHKLLWQNSAEHCIDRYESKSEYWFLPKNWNEIEKAIEEYDAKAWDQHYDHLQSSLHPHLLLKRLVLDPSFVLRENELSSITGSTAATNIERRSFSTFHLAIEYLLTDEAAPPVVDYRKWRRQLVERLFILATTTTTPDIITNLCGINVGDCKFTYTEDPLPHSAHPDDADANTNINTNCRACEKQLISGEGAYACVSCNLALHKSCADFPTQQPRLYHDRRWLPQSTYDFPAESTRACNSCGRFSYGCRSCIFETHLKWRKVPTVVNKPHLHPHPLSIQLTTHTEQYQGLYGCELCLRYGCLCSYNCVRCNSSYHLRCVHSPPELAHKHEGYLHLMKLMVPTSNYYNSDDDHNLQPEMFSRHQYLDQDFWCDVCYKEIDVDAAYYSCSDCPDYVAHIYCISPVWIKE